MESVVGNRPNDLAGLYAEVFPLRYASVNGVADLAAHLRRLELPRIA